MFENYEEFDDQLEGRKPRRNSNKPVRRPNSAPRRRGPGGSNSASSSPGGIRQRRNRRWNW